MLELALRVVVSLLVVLGLFWACARVGSRRLGGPDRALLRVRGRQSLSRGASMAVVEVGGRVLVVGVSDNGVRLLTELDPEQLPATPAPAPAAASTRRRTASRGVAAPAVVPVVPAGAAAVADDQPVVEVLADEAEVADVVDEADPVPDRSFAAVLADELPEDWGLDIFRDRLPAAGSHREREVARTAAAPVSGGRLAGSVLDAGTWRQAWSAATRRHPLPPDAGEPA